MGNRFKTFLPEKLIFPTFFFLFLLLITASFPLFLLGGAFCGLLFFLFRDPSPKLELDSKGTLISSPVYGRVKEIRSGISHREFGKNLFEIRLAVPFFSPFGVYFPIQAEIKNMMMKKGFVFFRYLRKFSIDQEKEVLDAPGLMLKTDSGLKIGLQFLECPLGLFPKLSILPGDRGKARANLGHIPFGGTVLLYLPENYEIIVKKETLVSPEGNLLAKLIT